jgi:lactate dehydrogenase-like 2-hydroxyacid dehydrogenase
MADIVVTRPLIEEGLDGLDAHHTVTVHDPPHGRDRTAEDVIAMAQSADALVPTVADPVPAAVFEACPDLRLVAQYGVGLDNVDLAAAEDHGVVVTHTPGVLTEATADFTWALLLAVARHVRAADRYVRNGRFERWETNLLLGMELSGKTIGIVGLGRIGAAVARRALGFGMDVVYHSRTRANPTVERQVGATRVDFETLLDGSDIVSLHCPLNEESHHLIDAAALHRMKPTALLVNTARGPIVDEAALVEALSDNQIAGAGLDVFEDEPSVHPGLQETERVVLAPHLASATREARIRMGQMCVESLQAFFDAADDVPHRAV